MERLTLRFPVDTLAHVRADAEAAGLTDTSVVRGIVAARYGQAPACAAPVRRYRAARPRPAPDVVEVARLREVVGELGGTLRQLAGLSREAGHGALWAELEVTLPRVRSVADDLDCLKAAMEAADLAAAQAPEADT